MTTAELKEQAGAFLATLREKYLVFRDSLPLRLGIYDDLLAASPEIDPKVLSKALLIHCNSQWYLNAVSTEHSQRFDLDGNRVGPVSVEHNQIAALKLAAKAGVQPKPRPDQAASKPADKPTAPKPAAVAVKPAAVKVSQGGTLTLGGVRRSPAG